MTAFGKVHGKTPAKRSPSKSCRECGKANRVGVTQPIRLRNHLPADAQVPAGFGTSPTCLRTPSGCPGIKGPVPPPVSMDARSVGIPMRYVNRSIRMKRFK